MFLFSAYYAADNSNPVVSDSVVVDFVHDFRKELQTKSEVIKQETLSDSYYENIKISTNQGMHLFDSLMRTYYQGQPERIVPSMVGGTKVKLFTYSTSSVDFQIEPVKVLY